MKTLNIRFLHILSGIGIYNHLNDEDIFVEIGTWTGQSSLYFAEIEKQMNNKKNIDFYTIDTFEGTLHEKDMSKNEFIQKGSLYEYYMSVREPLKDYIKVIKANSQLKETADLFKDESIAAIFIDGDHSHEGVKRDLYNWWPKIKNGGIFSGHDYIWGGNGVKPVIDVFSCFKAKVFWKGDVWYYYK